MNENASNLPLNRHSKSPKLFRDKFFHLEISVGRKPSIVDENHFKNDIQLAAVKLDAVSRMGTQSEPTTCTVAYRSTTNPRVGNWQGP